MSDQKTIEAYNKNAEDYHTRFSNDKPSKSLKLFMENLPKGAKVLDLGCGPGDWSALMQQAGFEVDATDASEKMIEIAREAHSLNARVATFHEIRGVDTYNGVWANFSLLHASREDFPAHLTARFTALKPGGLFHIGMKTGSDTHRDRLDRLYTYYEEGELLDAIVKTGFEIINVSRGKETGLAGTEDAFALVLAQKPST